MLDWVKELQQHVKDNIQLVFVANKIDMGEDKDEVIARQEADRVDAIYVQASAKTGDGVAQMFDTIAEKIYNREQAERERANSRERQHINHITNNQTTKKCC